MKIGISDGRIAKRWGSDRYLKLKASGFDYFDFNLADTADVPYTYESDAFDKYLLNEKRLADEAGVTVWQVHGPWRSHSDDDTEEKRADRLEKMKRSVHGAAVLGAKYWVIHPIMPCGINDAGTENAKKTREVNLDFMDKLLQTAKREGVTVCLENMPFLNFSLSSPTAVAEIVKELNDPSFAMCLDTGHANMCGAWLNPAGALREYRNYIKALHVHDNKGRADEHAAPFFGSIDWVDFVNALRETDFGGVLSLECLPSEKLPRDIFEDSLLIYSRIAKAILEL